MQDKQDRPSVPAAATSFGSLPDDALVDDKVVATLFSCSRKTVWSRAKNGGIWPRPIKVSSSSTRFRVGDIRKALAALTAA
jgi:predicted DNA-binding transcriptional regulator AlpA